MNNIELIHNKSSHHTEQIELYKINLEPLIIRLNGK